jgi:hypothetical protein
MTETKKVAKWRKIIRTEQLLHRSVQDGYALCNVERARYLGWELCLSV